TRAHTRAIDLDKIRREPATSGRHHRGPTRLRYEPPFCELRLDPAVGPLQALLERDFGLPLQHLAQAGVVAVPTADALGLCEIVTPSDLLPRDRRDHLHQLVNRNQSILPEVEWLAVVGHH